ncbi:MAG: hypothetical protein PHY34_02245 [Patescibacteria group bacterium]|nr:hypothetical protein [Patescibacteria group bacterium]MDD5715245.1 hypothetical protein [Patescibacteria group bacterium]
MNILNNKKGISAVEVLISIGMAGVMIVSIGMAMSAIHRLNTSSSNKEQALAYAKESIEIITENQQALFGCRPASGTCTCPHQITGYDSCWVETSNSPVAGTETITDTEFSRMIAIENLGGDANRKKITAQVNWIEKGNTKSTSLTTTLTAWKEIPPPSP